MSGKKWTAQDRLLSMALLEYEDSMCGGCGQPKDEAYDVESPIYYDAQEVVCRACKAQQEHGSSQKKPTPGAKVYVIAERPPEGVVES